METAKQKIIQYLEMNGNQPTGKIEDYMRVEFGTLGGTTGRRLRELAHDGVIERVAREYDGKKYFAYRVKPREIVPNPKWITACELNQTKLI